MTIVTTTNKPVIEMAREAGLEHIANLNSDFVIAELERFVTLVREDTIDKFNRQINQTCEEARLLGSYIDDGQYECVDLKQQETGENNDMSAMENVEQSRMGSSAKNDIEAAVLAEREACAKVCDDEITIDDEAFNDGVNACAAAIRARGNA